MTASVRAVSVGFGIAFGFLLAWSGLASPDVIRDALLLEDPYMYLMLGSAVTVGLVGTRLLRRRHARALLTGEEVACTVDGPERRHVTGSALFGTGWAIACACPGPIAVQVGQGVAWGVPAFLGMVLGVWLYFARERDAPAPAATAPGRAALASNPD